MVTVIDGRVTRYVLPRIGLELVTTLQVITVLTVVEALIRWVPLPRLSRLLGCPVDVESVASVAHPLAPGELSRRDRRRLRCTRRVADAWPLSRGPCLRRALTGGHLVRRLGPTVRLGTHLEGGELLAHAWLEIGGRPLEDVAAYSIFGSPSRVAPRRPAAEVVE